MSVASGLPSDRFSLFSEARERFGVALSQATVKLVPALSQVLSRQAERAIDLKARVELQEALHELNKQRDALPGLVLQRFNELVFKRLEFESRASASDIHSGLLALLPEAELEEQVYANDLAQRIRAAGGEEYAALVTRIHALTQFSSSEDQSPFSASLIAASFIMSLRVITHDRIAWGTIRPELSEDLPQDIAESMADVNDYLRQSDVIPELPRFIAKIETPVAPVAPSMPAAAPAASAHVTTHLGQVTRPGLIARAVAAVDQAGSAGLQTGRSFAQTSLTLHQRALDSQRMLSVESLEREGASFAAALGVQAYSAAAREKFFSSLRTGLKSQPDSISRDAQLAIIDVVHSLFDYALDEQRVPDAARPLMWRLQLPTVVLALLDPRYLGDQASSIRRLIENLAAIVTAFPDDVFKGSELYTRLESAVRAVEVVAHTLQSRTSVMAKLIEKQFAESSTGVAMIAQRVKAQRVSLESMPGRRNRRDYRARPSKEAEAEITAKLNESIESRLAGRDVPPAVRQFLREVWIRRLRSAALRDGQDSKDFHVAMQIVDDLLWSLEDKDRGRERRELSVQIPPLIQQLTAGVKAVGVDEKDLASFFDELFLVHLRRLQRQDLLAAPAKAQPLPSKAEMSIVQAMARPVESPVVTSDSKDEVDWPVLTEDLRIEVSSNEPDFKPSIPSLDDLVPKKGLIDSFGDAKNRSSMGARSARVKQASQPPAPMRIQGMDQLASAASIKLVTQIQINPERIAAPTPTSKTSELSQRVANLPTDLNLPPLPEVPKQTQPKLEAVLEGENAEYNLLALLGSVSIDDGHEGYLRLDSTPGEAVGKLDANVWVELVSSSQGSRFAKVAWLNPQRTLVLMVREKDRKALSMRVSELLVRFAQRRAFVLRAPVKTPPRDLR